jgi:hypothetical protein
MKRGGITKTSNEKGGVMIKFEEVKKILDELGVGAYPVPAQKTFYFSFEVVHDGLHEACLSRLTVKTDTFLLCSFFNGEVPSEKANLISVLIEKLNNFPLAGLFEISDENEVVYKTGAPVTSFLNGAWLLQQIERNHNTFRNYYPVISAVIRSDYSEPVMNEMNSDDGEDETSTTSVSAIAFNLH